MKTQLLSAILTVLIISLIISCSTVPEPSAGNDAASRQARFATCEQLGNGQEFIREEPFVTRPFVPYPVEVLNGRAVAYGCFREGQAPWGPLPGREEIQEDLTIISRYWQLIRVYNADSVTELMLSVIREKQLPIRVVLGVWLEGEQDRPEQKKLNIINTLYCLKLAQQYPELIVAISVGNETRVDWATHTMEQSNLIRYIRAVRSVVTTPVTTADDYNYWNKPESREVAAEVDFIFTHAHPLWNGKQLDNSIEWLNQTLEEVQNLHPTHKLVLGETGWATRYNSGKVGPGEQGTLMKGEVSLNAQAEFLIRLDEWVDSSGITTFIFEAFDEPWKGGGADSGPNEVEQNWGVFYETRQPKESFEQFLQLTRQ